MPFIPVLNVVQAELVYTWQGETVENVLHFEAGEGISVSDMIELGDFLVNWYDTELQPLHSNQITLVNVKLTDLNADFAPAIDVTDGLPLTGTVTGDSLPNNCALVYSKRTIFRGRSYRGRIYHPGLSESQVVGNSVNTTVANNLLSAYSTLISFNTTSEPWQMVVVSRYEDGAPREFGLSTPVVTLTTDRVIDSQRRRLPGRGT